METCVSTGEPVSKYEIATARVKLKQHVAYSKLNESFPVAYISQQPQRTFPTLKVVIYMTHFDS